MILRNIERRPLRSALSVAGVAAAVAIVVLGNFFRDAIEVHRRRAVQRGDAQRRGGGMVEPGDDRVRLDLARLPAVTQVESTRFVPVVLHHGHRSERSLIRGYEGRATLYRVVDAENRATLLDGRGPGDHRPPRRQARICASARRCASRCWRAGRAASS